MAGRGRKAQEGEMINWRHQRCHCWSKAQSQASHGAVYAGPTTSTLNSAATFLVQSCTIFLCSLDVGNIDDQGRLCIAEVPVTGTQNAGERSSSWITKYCFSIWRYLSSRQYFVGIGISWLQEVSESTKPCLASRQKNETQSHSTQPGRSILTFVCITTSLEPK